MEALDSVEERSAGVYGHADSAGGVGRAPPWCIGHAGYRYNQIGDAFGLMETYWRGYRRRISRYGVRCAPRIHDGDMGVCPEPTHDVADGTM